MTWSGPVRAAVSFGAAFVAVGLLVVATGVYGNAGGAAPTRLPSNFAMGAYLIVVTGFLNTLGFALVTAPFASWRRQDVGRALRIGAAAGVLALALQLSGVVFRVPLLLLLVGAVPLLGTTVPFLLPGVVTGLLAVLVAGRPA